MHVSVWTYSVPACVSSRADDPVSPLASPDCPHPQWARHKDHIVGVTWLKLEAAELDPGSAYEARLRVQMAALEGEVAEEERYEGVWSDWSQSACFAAPPRRGGRCCGRCPRGLGGAPAYLRVSHLSPSYPLSLRWSTGSAWGSPGSNCGPRLHARARCCPWSRAWPRLLRAAWLTLWTEVLKDRRLC